MRDDTIANSLHWFVKLEKKNNENPEPMVEQYKSLYKNLIRRLIQDSKVCYDNLQLQIKFKK